MLFVPSEQFTIETSLTQDEVQQRLTEVIESNRMVRLPFSNHKPYQGEVGNDWFEASRIIYYRNSFLPIIKGTIESTLDGCVITITMRPHILVTIFSIFWFGMLGITLLSMLCGMLGNLWKLNGTDTGVVPSIVIPLGLFVFGYLLITGGFKFESVGSKIFFQELFDT